MFDLDPLELCGQRRAAVVVPLGDPPGNERFTRFRFIERRGISTAVVQSFGK